MASQEEVNPAIIWQNLYILARDSIKTWISSLLENILDSSSLISIISEICNFATSTILATTTIIKNGSGFSLKLISGINLVSSMHLIFLRLKEKFVNFDLDKANAEIFEQFKDTSKLFSDAIYPNADTYSELSSDWFKAISLGLTSLFSAIIAGFGFSLKGISGLISSFRATSMTVSGVTSIKTVVDKILMNLVSQKCDPFYEEKKQVLELTEKAQSIMRMSLGEIASTNENREMCRTTIKDINNCLNMYKSPDTASLRSVLATLVRDVNKKMEEIDHICPTRQVTVGVFIQGEKAVGKSTLVGYMTEVLAKEFCLKNSLYNVSPGVRFYETYLNQDFGINNEFCATTEKDPFLKDANKICSSDPFNFEAAGLSGKVSSCQLKALFVTSNKKTPELSEMREYATSAFWDRFIIIEAMDPLVRNRRQRLSHRKSDFSHLRFNVKEVVDDGAEPCHFVTIFQDIGIQDILDIVKTRLAFETKTFYERLNVPLPENVREVITKHVNPEVGTYAYKYFGLDNIIQPNAKGRNFIVVRLQGIEGAGKTTAAEELAVQWQYLTTNIDGERTYEIQMSRNLYEFKPLTRPTIYIFDDWVSSNLNYMESHKYVERMNRTHNDSIFILTSNEIISQVSFSKDKWFRTINLLTWNKYMSPYDVTDYEELYSGIARRIGLDRDYYYNGKVYKSISSDFNVTVTFDNKHVMWLNNEVISFNLLLEHVKNRYINMKSGYYETKIFHSKPEVEQEKVDFELQAQNKELLFANLRTRAGVVRMFMNPSSELSLRVSERVLNGITNKNCGMNINPNDFICNEVFSENISLDDKYTCVAERMTKVLLKNFEKPTFRIYIKDTKQTVYFDNGNLYYYYDSAEQMISCNDEFMFISYTEPRRITPRDLAHALHETRVEFKFKGSMANCTMFEYKRIIEYYNVSIRRGNINKFLIEVAKEYTRIKQGSDPSMLAALTTAKSNKLLIIAITSLVGVSTGLCLYGLYKMLKPIEEVQSNAFANVGSTPPNRFSNNQAEKDKERLGLNYTNPNSPPFNRKDRRNYIYPNDIIVQSEGEKSEKSNTGITIQPNITGSTQRREIGLIYHEHVCNQCGTLYSHRHYFDPAQEHPKHNKACPNKNCVEFMQKDQMFTQLIQHNIRETAQEVLTPNSLVQSMGQELSQVAPALKVFFSTLDENQRKEVYNYIRSAKQENDEYYTKLTKAYPHLYDIICSAIYANMLSEADMIESVESELEILHRKLNQAYVCLHQSSYKAYALHIMGGMFLTVGHCFPKVEAQLVLSSGGKRVPAVVVSIVRERDIAIISAPSLKNLPSTLKYFSNETEELPLTGFFMRCGPSFEAIAGALEYKEYQEFYGLNCENELYRPTTEILKIRRTGMNVTDMVKKGDCGFPFIGKVQSSFKVIGIHNAYNSHSVIFGSFLTRDYIKSLCDVISPNAEYTSTPVVVRIPILNEVNEPETLEVSMPIEYADAFDETLKPDPQLPAGCHLTSVGFNPRFVNHGKLKIKHITHDIELENENMQLPAAYSLAYVEDFSSIVTNGFGRPDPLLTQAMKYKAKVLNYDKDILNHAIQMTLDYNKAMYCSDKPCRFLTEFEALNGKRNPYLSNMDIKTSAGPYAKYFGGLSTKQQIFDVDMTKEFPIYTFMKGNIIAQNLRNHLKVQRQLLEEHYIPPCLISQDNAKVENIDMEKAKKGKVRLFNNVDPSINSILKILFGDWFARVMNKSSEGYYAIGQNPYTTSTEIWHRFSTKQGTILNTDFKAFDKQIHQILIKAFAYIGGELVKNERVDVRKVYEAIGKTLTHAVHILNGSVYIVNNGNESGTFVTTLLNCVCVHIEFNYAFIKAWMRLPDRVSVLPMLNDIMSRSELGILGDDKTQIVSQDIPMTEEDLIEFAAELGSECTKAKADETSEGLIDFCSRLFVWDECDQIVYPRLKKSSIIGLLHWFCSFSVNQVRDNLMIALFEASMYDKEFYESVKRDALKVASYFGVSPVTIPFSNYHQARERLKSMMMNDVVFQELSALKSRENDLNDDICELSKAIKQSILLDKRVIHANKENIKRIQEHQKQVLKEVALSAHIQSSYELDATTMGSTSPNNNPVSACFEYFNKLKADRPEERYTKSGPDNDPTHTCSIIFGRREFCGEGPSKADAKRQAYGALREYLKDNIIPNASQENKDEIAYEAIKKIGPRAFALYIEHHIETAACHSLGRQNIVLITRANHNNDVEQVHGYNRYFNDGLCYFLSPLIDKIGKKQAAKCYQRYSGITLNDAGDVTLNLCDRRSVFTLRNEEEIYSYHLEESTLIPNMTKDTPLVGVTESDIPAPAPPMPIADSENALYRPIIMNHAGPSNSMLAAGGISFNITDLIYNQFVGCNKVVSVSDESATNSILASIPYDPVNNEYTNPFIQNFCLLHGRCTGSWLLKIVCPGNPGMTGSIGVAWMPRKVTTKDTLTLTDFTTFAFFTASVSEPFSYTIAMTDARESGFYRKIKRDSTKPVEIPDDMPHLVVFVQTKANSVFNEKRATLLTFYSKLASQEDIALNPSIKPFILAEPKTAVKKSDDNKTYVLNF